MRHLHIKNYQIAQERSQNIHKLTTEVTYRINRLNESMNRYDRVHPSNDTKSDLVAEFEIVGFYDQLRLVDSEGVFKELSERPLRSLLWELASLYENDSQGQKEILKSFYASVKLKRFIEDNGNYTYWSQTTFFTKRDIVLKEILPDLNLLIKGHF